MIPDSGHITEFVVIRHGQTTWNRTGRIQGHRDVALDQAGQVQAQRLPEMMSHLSLDGLICSDLQRATQTLAPLAQERGMVPILEPRLREWHLGDFEGMTFADVSARFPAAAGILRGYNPDASIPNGESIRDFYERAIGCFEDLATRHAGRRVLIMTHGGVIQAVLRYLLDISLHEYRRYFVDNLSCTRFQIAVSGEPRDRRLLYTDAVPIQA